MTESERARRSLPYAVVCECGWASFYLTHAEANAAQGGHCQTCIGPRTGIYTGHDD